MLDNKDKNPALSVEQNAEMIEPGMEFAPASFRESVNREVKPFSRPSMPPMAMGPGRRR